MREKIQSLGGFMAGMIIPNIGAFIAWGLITALFIPTGWIPNEKFAELVGPMIVYLLPILIGFTGGSMIYGVRGGVVGAAASMGVIVGTDIPMFLGAMLMGPLGGWTIKKIDEVLEDKIPVGFEMLINNFTAGIWAIVLILVGYLVVGPVVESISNVFGKGVEILVDNNLIALAAIIIEPAKILFMNNAINHGILAPLGVQQVTEQGYSLLFLLETNPGPGLGLLIAYYVVGKGLLKQSAPGAMIIHFLGGIHEIYFPYVLAHPIMVLSVIAGGMAADFWFSVTNAGLVATPSPGSIFAYLAVIPPGKHFAVLTGVAVGTVVSFLVGAFILRVRPVPVEDEEMEMEGAGISAVPGLGD
ncbi:MAG: PTS mannitol transporter subunit IICB [Chloroflexi bacterium]|jgi:PTS system mannitol-specific IIC component|nr:PTS mannitol transporter subunit IICB [Chloroflexota bacterium]MBK6711345.1 PTS mannitol transporter subunit IICB [Chloroflexota bacterium]MBK7176347.1 PTS mannitol transporter subunit IICB [Chloroflexota bacterium]MBK7915775.1 PTS mannitol transporter subunit IICB [Chloroflexota bacterium]MBK8931245.1 PTS mannitol transporter subunit IICB [Chloroflexota bacterium]